ncbi:Rrf2 family transcriptional regulator [Rhodoferax sp.]|uniref:Rrf2 family transcriptional regulator n=1 Tax=Rhodoferax sp. TaxID=50421 RepID=UPI00283EC22C|nr:Rrf2 family transcriptional regulator [Rhodoferax sp.]MDR3370885.1 Rrf2 family transcriptional regulator [Rhodoferax sp.]
MRISTKGRFAVTAMIDLALRDKLGPVPLSEIGLRHQISLSYLEQIFSQLRHKGLVTSSRGPGGGYVLSRSMDVITVADIVSAIEDEPSAAKQQDTEQVHDMAQDLWEAMNASLVNFMRSVKLRSLVLEQLAKGVRIEQKTSRNNGVFKKPEQQPVRTNVPNSVFALGKSILAGG